MIFGCVRVNMYECDVKLTQIHRLNNCCYSNCDKIWSHKLISIGMDKLVSLPCILEMGTNLYWMINGVQKWDVDINCHKHF